MPKVKGTRQMLSLISLIFRLGIVFLYLSSVFVFAFLLHFCNEVPIFFIFPTYLILCAKQLSIESEQ